MILLSGACREVDSCFRGTNNFMRVSPVSNPRALISCNSTTNAPTYIYFLRIQYWIGSRSVGPFVRLPILQYQTALSRDLFETFNGYEIHHNVFVRPSQQ